MSITEQARTVEPQAGRNARNLAAAHDACFEMMCHAIAAKQPHASVRDVETQAAKTIAEVYHTAVSAFARKNARASNIGLGSILALTGAAPDLRFLVAGAVSFAAVKCFTAHEQGRRLNQTNQDGRPIVTALGLPKRPFQECETRLRHIAEMLHGH